MIIYEDMDYDEEDLLRYRVPPPSMPHETD
jgi:hypothetical protein